LEELGNVHPIPNSFQQSLADQAVHDAFVSTNVNWEPSPYTRCTKGFLIDGKDKFLFMHTLPVGGILQYFHVRPVNAYTSRANGGQGSVCTGQMID
jgi:hypothetical protein